MKSKNKCGECTECCFILKVDSLNKANCQECEHLGNGCSIYDKRPKECQTMECMWLTGNWADDLRPDKAGFMFGAYEEIIKCYRQEWADEAAILKLSVQIANQKKQNIQVVNYARV